MKRSYIPENISAVLSHKACGTLLRYWLTLSSTETVASKEQLDPLEFWAALPNISIHIYEKDINDYRLQLAGDNIANLDIGDNKGLTLHESYAPHSSDIAPSIIEKWNEARTHKHCLITYRDLEQAGKQYSSMRCMLPLSNPEAILCFLIYGYDAKHAHKTHIRNSDEYRHEIYDIQSLKKLMAKTEQ